MNRAPKLSIGVPVYNGERYLRRALDSVLTQSFTDFELIISDNGSTDSTPQICAEYKHKDPRVRVVRHEQTMVAPLNFRFLYEQGRGEYFLWLACDDYWRPGFFERAVAILDENPGVVLVFSHMEWYNWVTGELFGPRTYATSAYGKPRTRLLTRFVNCFAHLVYGMFRRAAIHPQELLLIDLGDFHFAELLAVRGDTAIIEESLFVAGVTKLDLKSYSSLGGPIRFFPYWRASFRMIRQNFRWATRWLLVATITARTLRWMVYERIRPYPLASIGLPKQT